MKMRTPSSWMLLLWSCFLVDASCAHPSRPTGPTVISEAAADLQSGPTGVQKGATEMLEDGTVEDEMRFQTFDSSGEVSWPAQKRTQWRSAPITSTPIDDNTPLSCELRYQPESASLHLDAWNAAGMKLPDHHQSAPGLYRTEAFLDKLGMIFLRVQADGPQDAARFKLHCSWHLEVVAYDYGGGGGRRWRGGKGRPKPPTRNPIPDPWEGPNLPIEGRILHWERKDGKMILLIDKGVAAGVKVGQKGTVLSGKTGNEMLDGGGFQVTQVLSDSKCIAESNARSLGRNLRIAIFTK